MNRTMINIHEAKARFSEYARRVQGGETIILCNRNKPFAEIRPIDATSRPSGLAHGKLKLPNNFNEPDPEIEALFSGR
jgi:prevent-host-death family protein